MNYDPQYGAELETRGDWLISTEASFASALERAGFHELQAICRMPLFRLQLIMVATADRNDGIHDAIANNYAGALGPWMKAYEATLAARGFQLRKGITMEQFANILAAITEGFAIRHLGDPGAGVVGDGPRDNLFAMAVLAMMNSYLEPVNEPSGVSLRELFNGAPDASPHSEPPTEDGRC